MDGERCCAWMSGPRDAALRMPAAKWWLAISRDLLGKEYRRRSRLRPPAICDRTPAFLSPLSNR